MVRSGDRAAFRIESMTTIEWTDETWNPVRGCSVVSSGCTNCYAMKQAHRFSGEGGILIGLGYPWRYEPSFLR